MIDVSGKSSTRFAASPPAASQRSAGADLQPVFVRRLQSGLPGPQRVLQVSLQICRRQFTRFGFLVLCTPASQMRLAFYCLRHQISTTSCHLLVATVRSFWPSSNEIISYCFRYSQMKPDPLWQFHSYQSPSDWFCLRWHNFNSGCDYSQTTLSSCIWKVFVGRQRYSSGRSFVRLAQRKYEAREQLQLERHRSCSVSRLVVEY